MNTTYLTFAAYLVLMVGIGLYFCKRAAGSVENYLLGGRGMGSWVTALSAQASDMSGWLLMGLPGAVYLLGINQMWIAVGLAAGTLANWLWVAPRLRSFTEHHHALTIPTFLGERYHDKTRLIRLIAAILTLFFFTIYAASGLASAGKLFNSMFPVTYTTAVFAGTAVMIAYTLLGGYLAVCWTDLIQGFLMFFAVIAVPVAALCILPNGAVEQACAVRHISFSLLPEAKSVPLSLLAVLSTAAWGFGYFGQPHILTRFMSIRSVRLFPRTTTIAMVWVVISLGCAILIGLLAIPMFAELPKGDHEKVFILLISKLFHSALSGVLLAAILAAVMSTIDSQLLASSSTLVEDVYIYLVRPQASQREQMHVSRACVFALSALACILALDPDRTIFGLVKFAWGGLGAVFGPAVLAALYWKRSSAAGIIAGMICGAVALLGWYFAGWGSVMYEIVPGMAANFAAIAIFSKMFPADDAVKAGFDAQLADHRNALAPQTNR